MALIKIGLFGDDAELYSLENVGDCKAEIKFEPTVEGFVTIGGINARVAEGRCVIDVRLLNDGKYTPILIRDDARIPLPCMKKCAGTLSVLPPSDEYIRAISIKTRMLEKRVNQLELRLGELGDKVDGGGQIRI